MNKHFFTIPFTNVIVKHIETQIFNLCIYITAKDEIIFIHRFSH